jgi:hypothetical protein
MKTKNRIMTASLGACVVVLAAPASAATLLFSDSFDSERVGVGVFNDSAALSADQSGIAAPVTYTTSLGGGWGGAYQRGNGGTWLMYAGASGYGSTNMRGSLNYDIVAAANSLGTALEIKFNMSVTNGITGSDWTSFTIGSTNPFVNDASVGFSSLFRDNGQTQQFSNGTEIGSSATMNDGQSISFVLSNASGTGSAFNSDGANDTVKMFVGGVLTNTFTGLDLNPADQFISFHANSSVANIDNLSITAIPEPSAALLGGLGALALLRRRRA